jgi:hypothetical protein
MNIIKYISIGLWSSLVLFSCYEDKGNYDYHQLDAVVIDTTGLGIQGSYSISRFDTLSIKPKVYYNGELVNTENPQFPELAFSWTMYQQGYDYPVYDGDTLSTRIEFEEQITQAEINWELLFTVLNTHTRVKEFMKFSVKVNASLSEGWMVLYERDGATDVGLIVSKEIAPNVLNERVLLDIYSASNAGALEGQPVNLVYSMPVQPYEVFVVSDRDVARVSPITFVATARFHDGLFWSTPPTARPSFFSAFSTRCELLLNDNKIHIVSYMTMGSNRTNAFLGDPCIGSYGTLAGWAATSISSSYEGVFYDQTNKRFVYIPSSGSEVTRFPAQHSLAAFDCDNVGKTFVLADFGRNRYEYVVTKDEANHYYLLLANFTGDRDKVGVGEFLMDECPDIANISSVTAGYKGEIFYYAAGARVYLYDYRLTNTARSVWTAPAGETVTSITLQKYYYGEASNLPVNDCEIIYIATYNESTRNGTVYQLPVNPSNGEMDTSQQKAYTGFGKVKTMGWKRQ